MSLNLSDVFHKNYLFGYFNRNKKIFKIALAIFILFTLMGAYLFDIGDILDDNQVNQVNSLNIAGHISAEESYNIFEDNPYEYEINLFSEEDDNDKYNIENTDSDDVANRLFEDYNLEGFITLFIHNFSIDFGCVLSGLLFSLPSLVTTFVNAGQFGSIFYNADFLIIMFGVVPHGIFEIPSSLFALAGAFMITSFEFKLIKGILSSRTTFKKEFVEQFYLIKDAIISVEIIFVLLLIAAFIETFITPILLFLVI